MPRRMAHAAPPLLVALVALAAGPAAAARSRGAAGTERSQALLQTWDEALDGVGVRAGARDTPVTRAVSLLKNMQKTLQEEMGQDEELYDKLACWCNNNEYEKDESISSSEAKISELGASIEGLTAKIAGLKTTIRETEEEVAANKASLGEATALREKQQKEFHGSEVDSIQAIENLKAAIVVLSKHHTEAPESTVGGGAIFKSEKDSWESLLSIGSRDEPWSAEHEVARMTRSLDDFMRKNGFDAGAEGDLASAAGRRTPAKLLRSGTTAASLSTEDAVLVRRALGSAAAFMQAHHRDGYYPAYQSQSGEIYGILKQLKEEMEGDLSASQKREADRAASFADLRAAKMAEIKNGEQMAEQKEDDLATAANNLAEAKEDLGQEEASLSADQRFMANLKATCAEASRNFQGRKNARLQEIKAVSEAIEILTEDSARDAMTGAYSLLQGSSSARHETRSRREAARVLRRAAGAARDPQLSVLATTVELDAFTRVKKAIDDMVSMLKVQQADEVKKNDYCKSELQQNEMTVAKTEDHKAGLEAKSSQLSSSIQALEEGIAAAKKQISNLQLELQRASEDRQKENLDFQKTVADQTVTAEVLKKALERLATYYDQASFVQKALQAPPVPQMEYKPSKGSEGAMQLLEKLIQEAKGLAADSVHAEGEAQAAYEQTVADTNSAVAALQQEVVTKTKVKAGTKKDRAQAESDIADAASELEGLAEYNGDLHADCDYVMKNFGARQTARAQEMEALQQAKQILSGASLS